MAYPSISPFGGPAELGDLLGPGERDKAAIPGKLSPRRPPGKDIPNATTTEFLRRGDSALRAPDEPSIGLHQRDNIRLLETLGHLRDIGNRLIFIEHDRETMETADWIVDIGPGAGLPGGADCRPGNARGDPL